MFFIHQCVCLQYICSSDEGFVHALTYFYAHREPNIFTAQPSTSLNTDHCSVFLPQKIFLIGQQRELDQNKSMCVRIIDFPLLYVVRERSWRRRVQGLKWKIGRLERR